MSTSAHVHSVLLVESEGEGAAAAPPRVVAVYPRDTLDDIDDDRALAALTALAVQRGRKQGKRDFCFPVVRDPHDRAGRRLLHGSGVTVSLGGKKTKVRVGLLVLLKKPVQLLLQDILGAAMLRILDTPDGRADQKVARVVYKSLSGSLSRGNRVRIRLFEASEGHELSVPSTFHGNPFPGASLAGLARAAGPGLASLLYCVMLGRRVVVLGGSTGAVGRLCLAVAVLVLPLRGIEPLLAPLVCAADPRPLRAEGCVCGTVDAALADREAPAAARDVVRVDAETGAMTGAGLAALGEKSPAGDRKLAKAVAAAADEQAARELVHAHMVRRLEQAKEGRLPPELAPAFKGWTGRSRLYARYVEDVRTERRGSTFVRVLTSRQLMPDLDTDSGAAARAAREAAGVVSDDELDGGGGGGGGRRAGGASRKKKGGSKKAARAGPRRTKSMSSAGDAAAAAAAARELRDLNWDRMRGLLRVDVHEARGLPLVAGTESDQHPVAEVRFLPVSAGPAPGGRELRSRTQPARGGGRFPQWGHSYVAALTGEQDSVRVTVSHGSEPLASVAVLLKDLVVGGRKPRWHELALADGVATGRSGSAASLDGGSTCAVLLSARLQPALDVTLRSLRKLSLGGGGGAHYLKVRCAGLKAKTQQFPGAAGHVDFERERPALYASGSAEFPDAGGRDAATRSIDYYLEGGATAPDGPVSFEVWRKGAATNRCVAYAAPVPPARLWSWAAQPDKSRRLPLFRGKAPRGASAAAGGGGGGGGDDEDEKAEAAAGGAGAGSLEIRVAVSVRQGTGKSRRGKEAHRRRGLTRTMTTRERIVAQREARGGADSSASDSEESSMSGTASGGASDVESVDGEVAGGGGGGAGAAGGGASGTDPAEPASSTMRSDHSVTHSTSVRRKRRK